MSEVRVRFPPSPTGYLHIGSARTALFNWLFCRKHGGKLVLRIEDTDAERSTEASTEAILDGLRWMGIDWDEGPYLQTTNAEVHREAAERLVARGAAYRCYCTKEELDDKREAARVAKQDYRYDGTCRELDEQTQRKYEQEGRPSVVRFRVPRAEGTVGYDDMVFGRYEIRLADIEDFVVVRSNGAPLYILSNVADDHHDRITHVIRGADHLLNTVKQVLLYEALDWPVPRFAHIALTLDPQKAKISKRRHGEVVTVQFYKEAGFLPWGFCNFIALLGWSPGDDREVYLDREELIEAFSIERLGKTNSVFNYRKGDPKFITDPKALHINAQHIRSLPIEVLAPHVEEEFRRAGFWSDAWAPGGAERSWFLETLALIRVRYHVLPDFVRFGRAFFADEFTVDEKAVKKSLRKDPALREYLPQLASKLEGLPDFDLPSTEAALRDLSEELEIKPGLLINAARVAVSGQSVGPGIFEILCAVGRQRSVRRLRDAVQLI
jgi:glutamyl-tRNA synthetase